MDNFHLQDHSQKKWTSTHAIHRNCCFNFDSLVRKIAPLSRGRLNDISTKPLLNLYITIFAIQQDHLNLSLDITYQLNWFTATTTFPSEAFEHAPKEFLTPLSFLSTFHSYKPLTLPVEHKPPTLPVSQRKAELSSGLPLTSPSPFFQRTHQTGRQLTTKSCANGVSL